LQEDGRWSAGGKRAARSAPFARTPLAVIPALAARLSGSEDLIKRWWDEILVLRQAQDEDFH
jgi:hypothetical protein